MAGEPRGPTQPPSCAPTPEELITRFLRNARLQKSPESAQSPEKPHGHSGPGTAHQALCLTSPGPHRRGGGSSVHGQRGLIFLYEPREKGEWGREGEREKGREGEREGRGPEERGQERCNAKKRAPSAVPAKRALGWVLARGPGAPTCARRGPSSGWLPRSRALGVYCCQSLLRLLKQRGLLCAKGRRPRRKRKRVRTPRDHPQKVPLSEQLVGRQGGGDLGDTTQPTILRPAAGFLPGKQDWDLYPLVSRRPVIPLKGR